MANERNYTDEQLKVVADLIAYYIGGSWQTRDRDGCIVLWVQLGPNRPHQRRRFEIDRAGKVIHG